MQQQTRTNAINEGNLLHFVGMVAKPVNSVLGVGIDIISIDRVRKGLSDQSGLEAQLFTDTEHSFCHATSQPAEQFAARFAAKEAYLKAIGVGLHEGVRFREIEVVVNQNGRSCLVLTGHMKELAIARGVREFYLSLSIEKKLVVAVVILTS